MKAYCSTLGAWDSYRAATGQMQRKFGLNYPLELVAAIGRPHGLRTVSELEQRRPDGCDAVFLGVHDTRCLFEVASSFRKWRLPLRRSERLPVGRYPLVWAGGQGCRNPRPLGPVADLVVLGDAECSLPALLELWSQHGNTIRFLRAAAQVPHVFVPSQHNPTEVHLSVGWTPDVTVSLRERICPTAEQARIEITRGCRHKCGFCPLGWLGPPRHNSTIAILDAIQGLGIVHLQACDAEDHPGIDRIRESMLRQGQLDLGCTGRLDSVGSRYYPIRHEKFFNFGIEAMSYRVRRAIGKPQLTNRRVVDWSEAVFRRIDPEGFRDGDIAWHMIAGLPGQRPEDSEELQAVLWAIAHRLEKAKRPQALSLHWQPLQPLPGTPMQWCSTGSGTRSMARSVLPVQRLRWLRVSQICGRTDDMARTCAILGRSDERGVDLIEKLGKGNVTPAEASTITGSTSDALPRDTELPWDFVAGYYPRSTLERWDRTMAQRLEEEA